MNAKINPWHSLLLTLVLGFSLSSYAQEEEIPSDTSSLPSASKANAGKNTDNGELPPPKLSKLKEYPITEKIKQCKKYEGRYISYYETIYKVENCKRRQLLTEDGNEPKIKGFRITSVDNDTVAVIPEGSPLNPPGGKKPLTCAQLNGQYLISRGDEIFYVEKCAKRLFPDLDSYTEHSQKRGKREKDILELDEVQIARIEDGPPMKSSLDAEYKKLLDADTGIDVLPLAEACKGLNGKFVAYYSKIYRIENCRKQPVDPQLFGKRFPKYSPSELSSEQWISIPTGSAHKI